MTYLSAQTNMASILCAYIQPLVSCYDVVVAENPENDKVVRILNCLTVSIW